MMNQSIPPLHRSLKPGPNLPSPSSIDIAVRGVQELGWSARAVKDCALFIPHARIIQQRMSDAGSESVTETTKKHIYGAAFAMSILCEVSNASQFKRSAMELGAKLTVAIRAIDAVVDRDDRRSIDEKVELVSEFRKALCSGSHTVKPPELEIFFQFALEVHSALAAYALANLFFAEATALATTAMQQLRKGHRSLSECIQVGGRSLGVLAAIPQVLSGCASPRHMQAAKHFGVLLEIADDSADAENDLRENRTTWATDILKVDGDPSKDRSARAAFIRHALACFRPLLERERDGYRFLWKALGHQWEFFHDVNANTFNPPFNKQPGGRHAPENPARVTAAHGYYVGPLFIQPRLGAQAEEILVYKFRTMKALAQDEARGGMNEAIGKPNSNRRITFIGTFLRRYFIDELPQIINILKGDLRLVGLRPIPTHEFNSLSPRIQEHYRRHGPAAIGVLYAYEPSATASASAEQIRNDREEFLLKFYDSLSKRPLWTSLLFTCRVAYQIIWKGKRGL